MYLRGAWIVQAVDPSWRRSRV